MVRLCHYFLEKAILIHLNLSVVQILSKTHEVNRRQLIKILAIELFLIHENENIFLHKTVNLNFSLKF